MSTPSNLLLSVLALDSYNRGPDAQLNVSGDQVGDATVATTSTDFFDLPVDDFIAGFYASVYTLSDSSIVISYRGTINPTLPMNAQSGGSSIVNGWSAATGTISPQIVDALKFYQNVTGSSPDDYSSNVTVTGHSLGGGLAQMISILSGDTAVGFDWMPADRTAVVLAGGDSSKLNFGAFSGIYVYGEALQEIRNGLGPAAIAKALGFFGTSVQNWIAGQLGVDNLDPNNPAANVMQIAQQIANLENQIPQKQLQSYAGIPSSPVDLHNPALLTILLYANDSGLTEWQSIGSQLYQAYFNNNLGTALGFKSGSDPGDTGAGPVSNQMLDAIAYSTLDSGGLPYGSTGVRSLFSDADTLGNMVSISALTGLLEGSDVTTALAEIIVQRAGDLAKSAVTLTQNEAAGGGALSDEIPGVLSINLDPATLQASFQTAPASSTTPNIIGLGDLATAVLSGVAANLDLDDPTYQWILSIQKGNAGFTSKLDQITLVRASLNGDDISGASAAPTTDQGPGGAFLIGQYGQGAITGTAHGDDLIVGGATITTGDGQDIIVVGSGPVQLNLNGGTDVIYAGASTMDASLTYTLNGAAQISQSSCSASAGQTIIGASPGADLIVGNADGGDTFDFTNAGNAAFTVVWGGNGADTFNFESNSGGQTTQPVKVVSLSMSGITGANIGDLDLQNLQTYVDDTYGTSSSDPVVVLVNPSSQDKLSYNGVQVTSPTKTAYESETEFSYRSGYLNTPALSSAEDYVPIYWNAIIPNQQNFLQYYSLNQFDSLGSSGVIALDTSIENNQTYISSDIWQEAYEQGTYYTLADQVFEFDVLTGTGDGADLSLRPITYETTIYGGDPATTPNTQTGAGDDVTTNYSYQQGGGLDLVNFSQNEFGLNLQNGSSASYSNVYDKELQVLGGWKSAIALTDSGETFLIGEQPLQLGGDVPDDADFEAAAQQWTQQFTATADDTLLPSSVSLNGAGAPSVDINDFLKSSTGASGSGNGGVGGSGNSGSSGDQSVATFFANQSSLDFSGSPISITDTAAAVSAAFDALSDDASVTSITLTDSSTPTLTLTAAQVANDAAALGEIKNDAYAISVADSAADMSQNFDALNSNSNVTSIALTDSGTPSLMLDAAQAIGDTNALTALGGASFTITVADSAADVSVAFDKLNLDAKVSAITLIDSGTPTLDLTVAAALGDTTALGEITNTSYAVQIVDSAANVLANAAALAADTEVTRIVVMDNAADSLADAAALAANPQVSEIDVSDSADNVLANLAALDAIPLVKTIEVVDTVANVLVNETALAAAAGVDAVVVSDSAASVAASLDTLSADTSLSAIMLTDSGTPTLTLTAAQALNDAAALNKIEGAYKVAVVDTGTDIAANLDALQQDSNVVSITATDPVAPSLTLSVAQLVDDTTALGAITNANATIAIVDTGANVAANIDLLDTLSFVSTIDLTDANTPTLTLSAAQAVDDSAALGKITNASYEVDVVDTASDVSYFFSTLATDASIAAITLTDPQPTLNLTAAGALQDGAALAKVTNANVKISVYDTLADDIANEAALAVDASVASVAVVDTVANVLAGQAEIAADAQIRTVDVADSAQNVSANLDALASLGDLTRITLTDSGTPTLALTVAQFLGDGAALRLLTNNAYAIDIVDTAANVTSALDALNANSTVAAITFADSTPTLALSAAQAAGDESALALVTNANYHIDVADSAVAIGDEAAKLAVDAHVAQIEVTDTGANVATNLDALNSLPALAEIVVTDAADAPITISVAQLLGDTFALSKIVGPYLIAVSDTASTILANLPAIQAVPAVSSVNVIDTAVDVLANYAVLTSLPDLGTITIVDSAAAVVAEASQIAADPKISTVDIVDTAANVLANAAALQALPNLGSVEVRDSAANIAANIDAISQDSWITSIVPTDPGVSVYTLTAAQAAYETHELGSSDFELAIVDSAADVASNLESLVGLPISSITLTDGGTPTLTLYAYAATSASGVLSKIVGPYQVAIADTAFDVTQSLDAIAALPSLASISLSDPGTQTLDVTSAQAVADSSALAKITGPYALSVTDTAAAIAANHNALAANPAVTAITVVDSIADILAAAPALAGDTQISAYVVQDTVANALTAATQLADVATASSINVVDTAGAVSQNIDALAALPGLASISITSGFATFDLSVAELQRDQAALDLIQGGYTLSIVDAAANVAAAISTLNADDNITGITVVDTAANIQNYMTQLGGLSAPVDYQPNNPIQTVTAAEFLANQAALDPSTIYVSDSAAAVASAFDALNSDPSVSAITLTDSGTPTLVLTTAQALNDTRVLNDITNGSFAIAVSDSAANVATRLDALNADTRITSITLTDEGTPILNLTPSQAVLDTTALSKITTSYSVVIVGALSVADFLANQTSLDAAPGGFTISDTAANIAANLDALNADANLTAISLTDSGMPTLTLIAAQALNDTAALAKIEGVYAVDVVDTAANISSNLDALSADAQITSIAVSDNDVLTLTVSQLSKDSSALAKMGDSGYGIIIADTAANVATALDSINSNPHIAGITLTDPETPILQLSATQAAEDGGALGEIVGTYVINVVDSASNVAANLDALNANTQIWSITLTDVGQPILSLTAAKALHDITALANISNVDYGIDVADTAAHVAANLNALNADTEISSITLTDVGQPILSLTSAQALDDVAALAKISNANYGIDVTDTAASVAANLNGLEGIPNLDEITLTDSGTPTLTLTLAQAENDSAALGKVTTNHHTVISDTAANVLAAGSSLQSGWTAKVVDSTANVDANFNALNADTDIASITLTGGGTPTLYLTPTQAISDTVALSKITNASYSVVTRFDEGNILLQNTSTGQASLWEMNGTTQTGGGLINPNSGLGWAPVGIGDFNDDGLSDILWRNASTGQISIGEMNGNTQIGGGLVSVNPGTAWQVVGTSDFNHDGYSDIVWQNTSSGQVSIWEMNGNTEIGGGSVSANPGAGWKVVGTGDFNHDGYSDILWRNPSTGQISIGEMNGNTQVGGGFVSANPGTTWQVVGTGDFNHDGYSDIVWQNTSTGQVNIWEMNGVTQIAGGEVGNPGLSWHVIGVGGGGSDILLQNPSTGQASIWDMNGITVAGGGPVSPNPGTSLHAIGLT